MPLQHALTRLFTDCNKIGFWNVEQGRLIERLKYDVLWNWEYLPQNQMRYSVFCLSTILIAKSVYKLNTIEFDTKIEIFLKYIDSRKQSLSVDDLSYGGLTSLILGKLLYNLNGINLNEIEILFDSTLKKVVAKNDNQHALILIAGKYLNDISPNNERMRILKHLTDKYLYSQNSQGSFETGDLRAVYHQRNMYVLWGLVFSSYFYFEKFNEIKNAFEKTINWVWKNNRDEKDDAFYWHPALYWIKNKYGIRIPIYNQSSSKYLFECHQTFFSNSINFYKMRFNDNRFDKESKRSMEWIFGHNRINKNLNLLSGIDLPIRLMDVNGNLFIKGQQFKGSYEVGSYILALACTNFFISDPETYNTR